MNVLKVYGLNKVQQAGMLSQ